MSFLPNEVFVDVTNFLPNDDLTDLMLMSRNFNALVTPRLKKIDQEMSTMNQSIKSFMPSPAPEPTDNEWISQLDLKKFLPIGSEAKKRMKNFLDNNAVVRICLRNLDHRDVRYTILPNLKEEMSLERFDDASFLRILGALIAQPEFRQEYNIPPTLRRTAHLCYVKLDRRDIYPNVSFVDVQRIFTFHSRPM